MAVYRIDDRPCTDAWVATEKELIASLSVPTLALQEDTEDFIRKWIISQPQVGDVLHESPHDLPIKRIA